MAVTTPPSVSALPTAPSTSSPSTFSALADAFIGALATFGTQLSALGSNVFGNATDAASNATAAAASAVEAAASATNAAAAINAVKWVSGTTYADGAGVWSPINYQSYRRIGAGSGTTDPSLDPVNWAFLGASTVWSIKTANYTALAGDSIQANTTAGAFTITLPATPAANDSVNIADYAGTFSTNNLTVARNGSNIMGLAEDMTISTSNVSITFTYIDATQGWRLV